MAQLVSGRYANALFELAKEENKVDLYNDEVNFVYNAIISDKQFVNVINNPQISSDEKLELFKNIFGDKVSQNLMGTFSIVINKNREKFLLEIMQMFLDRVAAYKGIVKAFVTSAKELNANQFENIKAKLENNLNKQVEMVTSVDSSLIGGLKIQVDGCVVDNTIKRQLEDMQKQLLTNSLV